MKNYQFVAQVQKYLELGLYIGTVPGLPGAHSQGSTLDKLNAHLKEVTLLCIKELTRCNNSSSSWN